MKKTKNGFAFHVHHDKLVEFCTDYDGRVQYIKNNKPQKEQELRLRLFRLIPPDRIPNVLVKAGEAYVKAGEAYVKAGEAYDKAGEAFVKAGEACDKAGEACDKAGEAFVKAGEAYMHELIKLHAELCPDCPWDGKTIFPEK